MQHRLSKEELNYEYNILKQDSVQIGKKFNIKSATILYWMRKYNISRRKERAGGKNVSKLHGTRFGRLLVLEKIRKDNGNNTIWKCLCDCGKYKEIYATALKKGLTQSCGCFHHEKIYTGYEDLSGTFWYSILRHALARDLEVVITIEDAWNQFIKQEKRCALSGEILLMNRNYQGNRVLSHTASLDRIDNTKGYTKDNIQWVHKDINIMKSDFEQNEFIELCTKIAYFNKKDKL